MGGEKEKAETARTSLQGTQRSTWPAAHTIAHEPHLLKTGRTDNERVKARRGCSGLYCQGLRWGLPPILLVDMLAQSLERSRALLASE